MQAASLQRVLHFSGLIQSGITSKATVYCLYTDEMQAVIVFMLAGGAAVRPR